MKELKYTSTFACKISPLELEKREKFLSVASKNDNLRKLLPKDINLTDNIGFQFFSGESCVANMINANGDGIKTKEAILVKDRFPLCFVDENHSRHSVIGVIVDSSYTDYKTGKELTEEEVSEMTEPFAVSIAGIVWRAANPDVAEAIENSGDKDSEYYNKLFLSWEISFSDIDLIVMKKDDYEFSKGKLITNETEIAKLSNRLLSNGGNGFTEDGLKIGRVPIGDDITPLAVGIVANPAAAVSAIVVANTNESVASNILSEEFVEQLKSLPESGMGYQICDIEMNDGTILANISIHNCSILSKELNVNEIKDIKLSNNADNIRVDAVITKDGLIEIQQNNENNENKISQINNPSVKDNNDISDIKNSHMNKIEKFEQITDENIKELNKATLTEIFAASTKDLVDSKIKEISLDYTNKLTEKDKAIAEAQKASTELSDKMKAIDEKLSKASEDLQKVLNENAQRDQVEAFSARMESIENDFDLDDKQKEIVANKVKTLATDADFNSYLAEIEVLLAAKKKSKKPAFLDKEDKKDGGDDEDTEDKSGKKTAKASIEDTTVVADTLKNGEKDKTVIANTTTVTESLLERSKKAFGLEGWNVVNKRKNRS